MMSALPPKADVCSATQHVRFVPLADITQLWSRHLYRAVRSIAAAVNRVIVHAFLPITTNDGAASRRTPWPHIFRFEITGRMTNYIL